MSWVDKKLNKTAVMKDGAVLPIRPSLNFVGDAFTAADDPTHDRTNVTGVSGGGARVVNVSGTDHRFNGDASGGAIQIYPTTVLFAHVDGAVSTFDFDVQGVAAGWIVYFNIEGTGGAVIVRDLGEEVPTPIVAMSTEQGSSLLGIYFDGDDWVPLQTGKGGVDGALYWRPTFVDATTYTVDSGPTKDRVLLVDTSSHSTTVNLPAHSAGRILVVKDWKGSASTHPITLHRFGGTGKYNSIPADPSLGIRNYAFMISDGIDNWLDLTVAGS